MHLTGFLVALVLGLALGPAASAQQAPAGDPVIVTVSGKIGTPNRPPFDAFRDAFAGTHDLKFEKAAEFDRTALEKLGMKTVRTQFPSWPAAHSFEGPLLKDVLAAAGVTGGTLYPTAFDGYAAEIPWSDLERYPIILALKMDGRYMDIGGRGPAWVIYPRDDFPELQKEDDAKWVWALFHIRVD